MRTIKFRGQTINGRWVYGLLCKPKTGQYKNKIFISNKAGYPMAYEVNPETVGQFTGLKDKNGKEIYEGGIVRAIANSDYTENSCVSDIIFNEDTNYGEWQIRGKGYHHGLGIKWGGWISIEVIGNIHENPELIK